MWYERVMEMCLWFNQIRMWASGMNWAYIIAHAHTCTHTYARAHIRACAHTHTPCSCISSLGFYLSLSCTYVVVVFFKSCSLLNDLSHTVHLGLCETGTDGNSLVLGWQWWTAMPPLLLNHCSHAGLCAALSCWQTGFSLSLHLCLAITASLLNILLRRVHSKLLSAFLFPSFCDCW